MPSTLLCQGNRSRKYKYTFLKTLSEMSCGWWLNGDENDIIVTLQRAVYLSQKVYTWIKESHNLCTHGCCIGLWCSSFIGFDKSFSHCLTVETHQHKRFISTYIDSLSVVILKSWEQGISHELTCSCPATLSQLMKLLKEISEMTDTIWTQKLSGHWQAEAS